MDPSAATPVRLTTRTDFDMERGAVTATTDTAGDKTALTYDSVGRLATVTPHAQNAGAPVRTAYSYYLKQDQSSVVETDTLVNDTDRQKSWTMIDGLGRAVQSAVLSPNPQSSSTEVLLVNTRYDDRGLKRGENAPNRTIITTNPVETHGGWIVANEAVLINDTRYTYDAIDRPLTVETWHNSGDGAVKQWQTATSYGLPGVHTVTSPTTDPVTYTTDLNGNVTQIVEKTHNPAVTPTTYTDYATTKLEYSPLGWLTKVTSPLGKVSTYGYDALGRKTTTTDPDAGTSTVTYDGAGNVVTTRDAKLQQTSTNYDGMGRPTKTYTGAAATAPAAGTLLGTWTYDTLTNGRGKLASQTANLTAGSATEVPRSLRTWDPIGFPSERRSVRVEKAVQLHPGVQGRDGEALSRSAVTEDAERGSS